MGDIGDVLASLPGVSGGRPHAIYYSLVQVLLNLNFLNSPKESTWLSKINDYELSWSF